MDGWHLGGSRADDQQDGETLEQFITRVLAESDAPPRETARFLAWSIEGVMEMRRGDDWKRELAGLLREGRHALARLMEVFEAENGGGR